MRQTKLIVFNFIGCIALMGLMALTANAQFRAGVQGLFRIIGGVSHARRLLTNLRNKPPETEKREGFLVSQPSRCLFDLRRKAASRNLVPNIRSTRRGSRTGHCCRGGRNSGGRTINAGGTDRLNARREIRNDTREEFGDSAGRPCRMNSRTGPAIRCRCANRRGGASLMPNTTARRFDTSYSRRNASDHKLTGSGFRNTTDRRHSVNSQTGRCSRHHPSQESAKGAVRPARTPRDGRTRDQANGYQSGTNDWHGRDFTN